jgi:hypothetical protein
MTEWQPIETAPKEFLDGECGERILAYFPDEVDGHGRVGAVFLVWWSVTWCREGRWEDPEDGSGFTSEPTHWMPLPDRPAS